MALPPIFIEFLGSYTGLKAAASGVKKELAEVDGESAATFENMGKVSKVALATVGLAMAGVAYQSVKLASQFQSTMLTLSTQAGVPQSQLKGLSNSVLSLAGQVGFSPNSLAQALYHVESSFGSTGITGQKAMDILKVASEGAATGHADLVDVTNALDAAIASGIPGVQNYSQAMGALNAIVGAGDMSMQDLADAMSTGVMAAVKGYGLSLNDVGAALATFGDNNIRGSQAATDLRMAVQGMAKPAAGAADTLKKLGMTQDTLAKDLQTGGLSKALNDLAARMKKAGVHSDQMSAVLTNIVGKKAGTGLDVLVGQLDRVNSKYPEITKGANNFGNAVSANNETVQQKMNQAKAAFDSLGVQIGNVLLPAVTQAVGWIGKFAGFLASHRVALMMFAGAITAVAMGFAVYTVYQWAANSAMLASPLTWIVAAIVLLVVAIVELILHWKTVAAWLTGVWHDIVKGLGAAWHWLAAETTKVWHDITGAITSAWDAVVSWFTGALDWYIGLWTGSWNMIKDAAIAVWGALTSFFVGAYHSVVDPVVSGFEWLWTKAVQIFDAIAGFFMKWWPLLLVIFDFPLALLIAMWNHFHQYVFNLAKTVWGYISGFFKTVWSAIVAVAKLYFEYLRVTIIRPVEAAWHWLQSTWNSAVKWLGQVWAEIGKLASVGWLLIMAYIVDPVKDGWHWLQNTWNSATSWLSSKWGEIKSDAKQIWADIKTWIITPIDDAWQKVKQKIDAIGKSLKDGFNQALTDLKNMATDWVHVGEDIVKGIVKGIGNMAGSVGSTLKNMAKGALNEAKSFLGINSPSRLFSDEVGQWIAKGVAHGIDNHGGSAVSSIRNLASTLRGHFSGSSTSLGMSGVSSGSSVVNAVNVTVQGSVRSDRDLRDVVQEEMLKLGSRNTSTWAPFAL
jgi:TP901 family phage tail tape measure protein